MNTSQKIVSRNREYNKERKAIDALIRKIEKGLEDHRERKDRNPLNWGYIGDLKYFRTELQNLSDALNLEGEDAPENE